METDRWKNWSALRTQAGEGLLDHHKAGAKDKQAVLLLLRIHKRDRWNRAVRPVIKCIQMIHFGIV
jgi:hypothetical protein